MLFRSRRTTIQPPGLFALYVTLYCFGRFWIELLRIDNAHHVAGLRLNDWVAAAGVVLGLVWFRHTQRRVPRKGSEPPKPPGEPPRRLLPWRRGGKTDQPPAMAVPRGRVRRGR